MNASDIVAILSGVGTMFTAIYIGVNSFRDKTAKEQRKKEEETNKLMIEDMMRSVEYNKNEVKGLIDSIKEKEIRIKSLEDHIVKIQDDCQKRSLELITSLNLEKKEVLLERQKRGEAEAKVLEMEKEISILRVEIDALKKKI